MRAIVVASGRLQVQDLPDPVPSKGEVLVKVHRAGICGTDLEILSGYGGFEGIPGHEFVGTVVSGSSRWAGCRVVAEINCVCGRCDMCAGGLSNHCRRRSVLGIDGRAGAFAEYIVIPERNCVGVPDSVSDEEAVFAEPLAAAFQVVRQVKIEPRMTVAVLGTGRLGLLMAQVLAHVGCQVVGIGRNPKTLAFLDRRRIRSTLLDDLKQFGHCDVVVECTGSPEGLPLALRLVRPRGTIVLKTTCARDAKADLSLLVVNEVTLLGSRCGPLGEALGALAQKQIDVASMVTRRATLDQAAEALAAAAEPDHIKVLLKVAE